MHTIIVGAGIIGALTAYNLAQSGNSVTVIDAGRPGAGASGASFGWINASFYHDADHFALRLAAMEAHRKLCARLKSTATVWQGCLCWEEQGDAFDAQYAALRMLGYEVQELGRPEFEALEPEVAAPERALYFAQEGAVDLDRLTHDALNAATANGARIVLGVPVTGLEVRGGAVVGARWSGGLIEADRIVLATGTQTEKLLAGVGLSLPMLDRPGLIMRSQPLPPLLSHILVSPGQELRQEPSGRLLAPVAAAHQSDQTEAILDNPMALADAAAARVAALLDRPVTWEQVALAYRPVPKDGLPVVGACGPEGLYVTTMHSGATLAPLVAEIAAREISGQTTSNAQAQLIAPYRPQRFSDQGHRF